MTNEKQIEPRVGDVWQDIEYQVTIAAVVGEGVLTKFFGTYSGSNIKDFNEQCELIERDGKRGEELWQTFTYGDCPPCRKEQLKQAEKDGFVIEILDAHRNWIPMIEPAGWLAGVCYRITDRKREEPCDCDEHTFVFTADNGHECTNCGKVTHRPQELAASIPSSVMENAGFVEPQPDADESSELTQEEEEALDKMDADEVIDRIRLARKNDELEKQIAELTKERDTLKADNDRLRNLCNVHDEEADKDRKQLNSLKAEHEELRNKYVNMSIEAEGLEEEVEALQKDNEKLKADLKQPDPQSGYLTREEITDEIAKLRPDAEFQDFGQGWSGRGKLIHVTSDNPPLYISDAADIWTECRIKRSEVTRLKEGE